MHAHAYNHARAHTRVRVRTHACKHACMGTLTQKSAHTCVHTYVHTCTHTHTYISRTCVYFVHAWYARYAQKTRPCTARKAFTWHTQRTDACMQAQTTRMSSHMNTFGRHELDSRPQAPEHCCLPADSCTLHIAAALHIPPYSCTHAALCIDVCMCVCT